MYRNRFCASTDGSIEYLYAKSSPCRESLPKNMITLCNCKTESRKNRSKPDKQNIIFKQGIPLLIFESLAPVSCDRQLLLPSGEYGTKYMLPNSSPLLRIHPASKVGVRQSVPSSAIYDCTSFVIFEDPPIEDPLLLLLPTDNCDRDWKIYILPIINQNNYHHKYN